MKHKKAMVYGLGFLVVCIWGLIILRIFSAVGDKDADLPVDRNSRLAPKVEVPVLQPDTFQLQLNYPDPFLKSDQKEVITVPSASASLPMNGNNFVPKPAAPVVKPVLIQYLGYIASTGCKQKIAIMNQDGKERMMTEGQLTDQLQLLKIGSDSVKIKYKGKTSFIRINK